MKGLGTLAPQTPGAEIARAVEIELRRETDNAKSSFGGDTRAIRRGRAEKWRKSRTRPRPSKGGNGSRHYHQIPPLPRPVTPEAIAQAVRESPGLALRLDACTITITAATAAGNRASLIKLIGQFDHSPAPEIQKQLNSLPKLLSCMIVPHAVEGLAAKFESLGATVQLRPGWNG